MTRLAIMQPYLFPYLGYFQLIHAADKFVVYDNLDYIRHGWVNRNRLLAVRGEPFYFTVPVCKKSANKKIRNVQIKNSDWKIALLNRIHMNYRRSHCYDEIFELIESVLNIKTEFLSELNKAGLIKISRFLGIDTKIIDDDRFAMLEAKLASNAAQLKARFPQFSLGEPSAKIIRILEICKTLKSGVYINPWLGAQLYPKDEFMRNHLEVKFLRMRKIRYPQICAQNYDVGRFSPSLSIIDVLMNCGKEKTAKLLNEFEYAA